MSTYDKGITLMIHVLEIQIWLSTLYKLHYIQKQQYRFNQILSINSVLAI
jgi:hypothetical protein